MKCDSIPANPRGSDVHLFPPTIWRERISGELVLYDASISMKSRVMIIKKEKAIYELYASSVKPKLVSEILGYNNLWPLVMNTAAKGRDESAVTQRRQETQSAGAQVGPKCEVLDAQQP